MTGNRILHRSPIERALVLARSGAYTNISEITKALIKEGFVAADVELHLNGISIRKQLRDAIKNVAGS